MQEWGGAAARKRVVKMSADVVVQLTETGNREWTLVTSSLLAGVPKDNTACFRFWLLFTWQEFLYHISQCWSRVLLPCKP